MVDGWAGKDFVFLRIGMTVDDGHVDEALVEEFHHGRAVAAGDMKMHVGGVHEEADAVRFGRADADVSVQFRIVTSQFLFGMTGQGEDFFSPLLQEQAVFGQEIMEYP